MSDAVDLDGETKKGGKLGLLMKLGLPLICLGGGFAVSYLGIWAPQSLLEKREKPEQSQQISKVFVALPPIVLTLAGPRSRNLVMGVKIETDPAHASQVEYLQPRILDAFNSFLADIDPAAFERRGILDVVRNELVTRLSFILGADAFSDVLITEFRIQ